jgi:hypothetical protein
MDFLTFLTKLLWPGIVLYLLLTYRKYFEEFLKTLIRDWEELQFKGVGVKRNKEGKAEKPPEPTGITSAVGSWEELSEEARIVLSTLWRHQQDYYTDHTQGRWTFMVGIQSPRYADFLIGTGETMKKGLVTISPQNGQYLLTDSGISFCLKNKDKIYTDWDFNKWKSFD